jgi:predicted CXXCH cytochrome family protein
MQRQLATVGLVLLPLLALGLVQGCGGHSAQAPPAPGVGTAAFVGAEVCQACHRSAHAAWSGTAHADALATLQGAGQAENPSCLPCHTVGYGEPTGYTNQSETPQLANVQCENCHGGGGKHVSNPSQNPMRIPLEAELCANCHQGFHHPTFEQWSTSRHAAALETIRSNPHGGDSCLICHSAEAILATGQRVVLAELTTVVAKNSITCVACHNPHGSPNEAQLREPTADICLTCHTTGGTLPGNTPHHAQREMLLGIGGFEATGDEAIGPNSGHTTAALSRCVTCHVFQEHPTDPTRENPVNTGHTFEPNVPNACRQCHPGNSAIRELQEAEHEIGTLLQAIAPFFDSSDPSYIDPATLPSGDIDRYNVAKFNYQLVEADASHGVHNLAYARRLLQISQSILASL